MFSRHNLQLGVAHNFSITPTSPTSQVRAPPPGSCPRPHRSPWTTNDLPEAATTNHSRDPPNHICIYNHGGYGYLCFAYVHVYNCNNCTSVWYIYIYMYVHTWPIMANQMKKNATWERLEVGAVLCGILDSLVAAASSMTKYFTVFKWKPWHPADTCGYG